MAAGQPRVESQRLSGDAARSVYMGWHRLADVVAMPATSLQCPACGYANDASDPSCSLCGGLLGGRGPPKVSANVETLPLLASSPAPRVLGLPETVFFLVAGGVLAPVFTFTPLLQRIGWLLTSLVHEMGHTAAALFVGCSAVPAIRLDGHAMTSHGPQHMPVALATWAILGFLAWKLRARRAWMIGLGATALVYPLLSFTPAREVVHLLGGHAGELAIAGVFLWRALSGGFTEKVGERVAYATCAWHFVGCNLWLTFGLIFSVDVQLWYVNSGSFGLTNDYIRLASHIGWKLESVAVCMLLLSLAVVPLTLWICRRRDAAD